MVHLRLNETETNPNPHINFITALPGDVTGKEEARQLLRALAAQVRPVMKAHGFVVNSFEEYEYNNVFAGRNWNNGETVELVLRRPDGAFYPIYWLMGTLCHELAHIKHMNHGPDFQKLWSRLNAEVRQLQDKGYYGDGYWSSGTRLCDSARVGGQGIEDGDFPEYMCGGAQNKARPTARRRRQGGRPRGKRREVQPSLHTGAQTAKKRKSGARVTSKYAFAGEGATLASEGSTLGTGFGKKAASKRARDERALAAEKRLQALLGPKNDTKPAVDGPTNHQKDESDEEDDDEVEFVPETDADRRQALLASEHEYKQEGTSSIGSNNKDLKSKLGSGAAWKSLRDEFNFSAASTSGSAPGSKAKRKTKSRTETDVIEIPSDQGEDEGFGSASEPPEDAVTADEDEEDTCDLPVASGSTFTTQPHSRTTSQPQGSSRKPAGSGSGSGLGLGKMVQTEMDLRRKEALGMAPVKGGGRTLGAAPVKNGSTRTEMKVPQKKTEKGGPTTSSKEGRTLAGPRQEVRDASVRPAGTESGRWACLVCTLDNQPGHLACAACATPRGSDTFASSGQTVG